MAKRDTENPDTQPEAAVEDTPPNGLFVLVERQEGGTVKTGVSVQGDVRLTEVDTILAVARIAFQQEAGLNG